MSQAYLATHRTLVAIDNEFFDCIAVKVDKENGDVSVYNIPDKIAIIFYNGPQYHMSFVEEQIDADLISFVLIDPTKTGSKQVVAVAKTHWFDESRPGEVYFLQ